MTPGDRVSLLINQYTNNRLNRTRAGTVLQVGLHGVRVQFDDEPGECPSDRWSMPEFLTVTEPAAVVCYDDE
jgi:hypothetical protein